MRRYAVPIEDHKNGEVDDLKLRASVPQDTQKCPLFVLSVSTGVPIKRVNFRENI